MTAPFNLSVNETGLVGLFVWTNNNLLQNLLGPLILITLFVILYISTGSDRNSISSSLFVTFVVAVPMSIIGLVSYEITIAIGLATAIMSIALYTE